MKAIIGLALLGFLASLTSGVIHMSVDNKREGALKTYCIVMEADSITGSLQYNTKQDQPAKYDFEVNPVTILTSGKCRNSTTPSDYDMITVKFDPKGAPVTMPLWELAIFFGDNTAAGPATFASAAYSLDVTLDASLNASAPQHIYQNDVMPFEMKSTTVGNGFSCSSTTLKLGTNSWITFSGLKVVANVQAKNDTIGSLGFDKCAADAVPEGGSSVGLIIGIIVAVLVVVGVLAGLTYYFKRVRVSH